MQVADASPEVFRGIFEAQYGYACRALRRLGVRDADVPDVAQELFLRLYETFDAYDRSKPLQPWLYAFAVRLAANYRKLARHKTGGADEVDDIADARVPRSDRRSARDLLQRGLAQLDFDQRVAVLMHDFEGMRAQEIADAMDTPLNTVYSRIRLGREALRRAIGLLESSAETGGLS